MTENKGIIASNISKKFQDVTALSNISLNIKKGSIFGLIGTNGAGKSTIMRIFAGVLESDSGSISIDGLSVYENTKAKEKFFYISDDQFFFSNITPLELGKYYKKIYKNFDMDKYIHLLENFELPYKRKINTYSKGMKKQVSILCALASNTEYIFCDETFDGLDPVMRQGIKSLIASEVAERELTAIIASHNLRELEDICDHIGLLHKGGMLLNRDLDDMKLNINKIQAIFTEGEKTIGDFADFNLLSMDKRGSLYTLVVRGTESEVKANMEKLSPQFYEVLPLSLEEIFISETEVFGYDIKKLLA